MVAMTLDPKEGWPPARRQVEVASRFLRAGLFGLGLTCGMGGAAMAEGATPPAAPDYIDESRYLDAAKKPILPPEFPWDGASQRFIAKPSDPFITLAESSDFQETPGYAETLAYLRRLAATSKDVRVVNLEEPSGEGRPFAMAILSRESDKSPTGLKASGKPTVFVQAGIHPGEISGKDAGLMLLRDLSVGGSLAELLERANLLFVPVVNIDGHERFGLYGRVNQRGPTRTGWRSNAQNLNLNRDFVKIDSPEIRNVVRILERWDPDLFIDLHDTDGVNYQYDVTYCNNGENAWSPKATAWMNKVLSPQVDRELGALGHLPFVCIDEFDSQDLTAGFYPYYTDGPRYSNAYADARQIPGILVEIHALKPYKRRVLGTYVFLKAMLEVVGKEAESLRRAIRKDRRSRPAKVVLSFKAGEGDPKTVKLKAFRSELFDSPITGDKMVRWTNEPVVLDVPVEASDQPAVVVERPEAYYIPVQWRAVIKRLAIHGVEMEVLEQPTEVEVVLYRLPDAEIGRAFEPAKPFGERLPLYEGRLLIKGAPIPEERLVTYPPGSVRVPTDQDLGTLAMLLLEPQSPDSFLQWGFFNTVMTDAEQVEGYILEPMAQRMLEESPELAKEFEAKLESDPEFAKDRTARLFWFYQRTPFADQNRYLYPVGRVE